MDAEAVERVQSRIGELRRTIRDNPGRRAYADLLAVRRMYRVFSGNVAELRSFLAQFDEPPAMLELWDNENREGFERFLDEMDRLLHNCGRSRTARIPTRGLGRGMSSTRDI